MKKNQSLIMRIYQPYGDLKDESICDYEVNYLIMRTLKLILQNFESNGLSKANCKFSHK